MFNGIGITAYSSQEGGAPGPPSAPLVLSQIAVTQTSIALTFNKSVSGTEALGFTFDGTTSVTLASATGLPGNTITFNLNETLYNDSNVLLSYSSVTGDIAGTVGSIDLASFSNLLVNVFGLPDSPAFSAPTVSSVVALTQSTIQVTFDQSVSGTPNLGWTWGGTTPVTVASTTALPATSITFTINETLYNDSNVLVSYDASVIPNGSIVDPTTGNNIVDPVDGTTFIVDPNPGG